MKIIKPGKVEPAFWWLGKQFSCRKCGCEFELEKGDYPNNDVVFTIPCPTCKQTLRVTKPLALGEPLFNENLFYQVFGDGKMFDELFEKYTPLPK